MVERAPGPTQRLSIQDLWKPNFTCSHKHVSMDLKQTEICFTSICSDSDYLFVPLLFWNGRTLFLCLQVCSGPFQQARVLSQWLVSFLSLFLHQHLDVSPDWSVCFPGKGNASAGGTNPPAAVWFPPSGEKVPRLTCPSSVSQTLMEHLRVFPAQVEGTRRRTPSSAPPLTPEPSCVGFPAADRLSQKSPVALTLTSLPVLLFSIFHHAHVLERHACHSVLSRFGLAFGVAAALGAFVAGNCNVSAALAATCTQTDAFQAD